MSRVRVTVLLLCASLFIASCRQRAEEAGKAVGPAQPAGGEVSDGGEVADFVLAGTKFSFRGRPLPFCEPASAWTAVLGRESWSEDRDIGWNAPLFLTCQESPRGRLIQACTFFYRRTANGAQLGTLTVSIDGARIGPETVPSELNLHKRGTRLVSLWDPLLYETRRDDNTDPYFVEVDFDRAKRLTGLTISTQIVHNLARCANEPPPPPPNDEDRRSRELDRAFRLPPGPERDAAFRALRKDELLRRSRTPP